MGNNNNKKKQEVKGGQISRIVFLVDPPSSWIDDGIFS
jgi:hypothetical protein